MGAKVRIALVPGMGAKVCIALVPGMGARVCTPLWCACSLQNGLTNSAMLTGRNY